MEEKRQDRDQDKRVGFEDLCLFYAYEVFANFSRLFIIGIC